jgi:glycosyltransferase involved in cell wall biosynthesis
MKICLLGSKSDPPRIGGIETHVFELAQRLALRGHEVNVIAGRDKHE